MVTESKKYHPSRFARLVIYPIGFLLFLCILSFVLILANGYQITVVNNHLKLTKTGMIIVTSRPNDASITMDGKNTKKKTGLVFLSTKLQNVSVGKHRVTLEKEGYRSWSKVVDVNSNLVTWLNYVLLFPNDLKISNIEQLQNKRFVSQSKNKRFMLFGQTENGIENYYILDNSNSSLKKIWPKPTAPTDETLKNPYITSGEFNQSNDRLFVWVKNGAKQTPAVLDISDNGTITNLSSKYPTLDFKAAKWSLSDATEIYVQSAGTLYLLNLNGFLAPKDLETNVVDYSPEKDRNIYFVYNNSGVYELRQMLNDGSRKQTISKAIIKDSKYKISYSSYVNAVAILPITDKTLTTYYKLSNKVSSIQLAKNVRDFDWSQNGKKLLYYNNEFIKTFDWDTEEEHTAEIPGAIAKVSWYFDDAHFLINTNKGLSEIDFDGENEINFTKNIVGSYFLDQRSSSVIFTENNSIGQYKKYLSGL